jgi:hypothetical protein
MTSPTTPPPGHEIISPDIAKQRPPGLMQFIPEPFNKWVKCNSVREDADFTGKVFCAPLGTLAALSTPLPEVRCECGVFQDNSNTGGLASFQKLQHDALCPARPRNRLVRVLPGQLARLKVKPEELCWFHSGIWWQFSGKWSDFNWLNPDDDWGIFAYALPQWSYDAAMGRGEDDIDLGEGVRTFGYRLTNPSLEGWNTHQPTHRCNQCGAYWMRQDETWTLCSPRAGACCDNAHMGPQIIALSAAPKTSEPFRTAAMPSAEEMLDWLEKRRGRINDNFNDGWNVWPADDDDSPISNAPTLRLAIASAMKEGK